MNRANDAGTALRMLCLPIALSVLASCQRQLAQVQAKPNRVEEVHQLLDATKRNPSLRPGSNEAGPPIHVDPYPHSAGMVGMTHKDGSHHEDETHHITKR
jgi:hypothetical protein